MPRRPDGNLWFTENTGNQIGRMTPAGVITEFPLPTPNSLAVGIVYASDGNLWFTEYAGRVGRITLAGTVTEFPVPTAGIGTAWMAAGPDGNVWFTENGGNKVARIGLRLPGWPSRLDLNSDGLGDVFLYNQTTGARAFEVTTSGGFTQTASAWDPGWQVYPAQLNADGYTDFFLYDPARGLWIQALNHGGDGTFTYTLGNWDSSWTVVPSDLDGDGLTDLFVYNVTTGVWVKCFVNGSGAFGRTRPAPGVRGGRSPWRI